MEKGGKGDRLYCNMATLTTGGGGVYHREGGS